MSNDLAQPERLKALFNAYRTPLNERPVAGERPTVIPLVLTADDLAVFERLIPVLRREWDTDDLSEIIVRAVTEAVKRT